jgi:hypothetical protein
VVEQIMKIMMVLVIAMVDQEFRLGKKGREK